MITEGVAKEEKSSESGSEVDSSSSIAGSLGQARQGNSGGKKPKRGGLKKKRAYSCSSKGKIRL